jgi:Xaa-Pro aminopeptidase
LTVKIGYSHIGLNYLGFYFELSDDPQLPHHSGGLGADGDEAGAGHGIGIEARDCPIFTKPMKARSPFLPGTYDLPVEEGMVISIEVPYGELGLGGVPGGIHFAG